MQTNPLIQEIDQSLKFHYHEICFNPEKRDTLHRLSTQEFHSIYQAHPLQSSSIENPQFINNNILSNYVQYIYQNYQIEDPIAKEYRLSNHSKQASISCNTPKTQANGSSDTPNRPESTKSKLQQMRQSYKEDSSEILYSRHFYRNNPESDRVSFNLKELGKHREIGYKTKQKIQFKNLVKERSTSASTRQNNLSSKNQEDYSMRKGLVSPKAFAETQTSLLLSEIPVVFRYCPMCEEAVLEHNIPYHEAQCPLIQQAYQLPLQELQYTFCKKVEMMVRQLGDQMKEGQEKKMQQFRVLKERIKQWLEREDGSSFEAVKEEYNKLALNQYYLVTKLNWFKQLQRRIMQERQIHTSPL